MVFMLSSQHLRGRSRRIRNSESFKASLGCMRPPTQKTKLKNKTKQAKREEGSWRLKAPSHAVSGVPKSFRSRDSAVNKIVLEIGCSSSGALPLQFSVRQTRLFEVHPDVTSHANRRGLVQALSSCPLLTASTGGLALPLSMTQLWLSAGCHHAHIQDTLSVSGDTPLMRLGPSSCCPS